MAFDGVTIANVVSELKKELITIIDRKSVV